MRSLAHIDKTRVLAALRAKIEADLATMTASQREAQEAATHEEAKPEGDKDTRAIESSYLARGQAKRVAELTDAAGRVGALELRVFAEGARIAVTALLTIDDGDEAAHYFVAPAGGGVRLVVDDVTIRVITPASPLGRALLGKAAGDEIEVKLPQGSKDYAVEWVG